MATPSIVAQREKQHAEALEAALKHERRQQRRAAIGLAVREWIPPVLRQAAARPSYQALERQIARYQAILRAVKDCQDRRCSLCARCLDLVWFADEKARRKRDAPHTGSEGGAPPCEICHSR